MIFICYRREDVPHMADRIAERLGARYGAGSIFKDVDSIMPGEDWLGRIHREVAKSQVMLAIIGPHWIVDQTGRHRFDAQDYILAELQSALQQQVPVIPVLVELDRLPAVADLPEPIRPLLSIQVLRVRRDPDFHRDIDRLTQACEYYIRPSNWRQRAQRWLADPARYREAGALQMVCFSLLAALHGFYAVSAMSTTDASWHSPSQVNLTSFLAWNGLGAIAFLVAAGLGWLFSCGRRWAAVVATAHLFCFLLFCIGMLTGLLPINAGGMMNESVRKLLYVLSTIMASAMTFTSLLGLNAIFAERPRG